MPPSKRLSCDDPEWTRRKDAIEEMYVFGRLSQKKIRDKLGEDGFSVTKSELEAQLRFWNIRKNASADAWRYTDYRLLKREQQGKDSVVYYNGRKVTRNALKKERRRYQSDTLTKYMSGVSCESKGSRRHGTLDPHANSHSYSINLVTGTSVATIPGYGIAM
ncbi:hypothetical protein K456DRAFT_1728370 [Colletotrichum gloeosporioides 23]|nr:hypothetical protein K456DRAFT_1728370 [Colletotrichum gloeosporioides 23]